MTAAVEVIDLTVRYGGVTAVDGATFEGKAGEVTAVLGPNGAGKTSTVETLEGYRRPTAGRVRVLGLDPVADGSALHRRIGVMLQSGGVYPTMSAGDALRLFASYYEDPLPVPETMDALGLTPVATTPWKRLSGGEQQRLSLALALIGRPDVAFLDEPTAGVDPAGRIVIRDVIRDLRSRDVAVLLTTHELEEASKLADRVVIMDHGAVVANGTPAELMASGAADDVRFGTVAGIDTARLARRLGVPVTEEHAGEYRVAGTGTPELVAALTAWLAEEHLPIADLRAGRQTLEDVFLRLTGTSTAELDRAPARRRERSGG